MGRRNPSHISRIFSFAWPAALAATGRTHKDNTERDWDRIRADLGRSIITDIRLTRRGISRTLYRVDPDIAERLAKECIYVEQGRSSKRGAQKRPLFERMKRDASQRRFTRLLVWKVSRLGRDMREVISTVYELADLRSEEHTSELQSQSNLVCRLLLEKKKPK